jgi:hypothetical protein
MEKRKGESKKVKKCLAPTVQDCTIGLKFLTKTSENIELIYQKRINTIKYIEILNIKYSYIQKC